MTTSTDDRTSQAVITEFTDLHRRFRELVTSVDPGDLNRRPLPGENTIAILTKHAVGSERFLLYRAIDRTITRVRDEEFQGEATADELVRSLEEADRVVLEAAAEGLQRDRQEGARRSPAELVMRALTHTGEHLAQAELTRTLLAARS